MSILDTMKEILHAVESLEDDLRGLDKAKAEAAQEQYNELLNKFYKENQDILASQQYEAAKKDFEYFLRLLELAIAYWKKEFQEASNERVRH